MKIKKLLAIILSVVILTAVIPTFTTWAWEEFSITGYDFVFEEHDDEDTLWICGYEGEETSVIIPESIEGKKVTLVRYWHPVAKIEEVTFSSDITIEYLPDSVKKVNLPDNSKIRIKNIYAFWSETAPKLESLYIPDNTRITDDSCLSDVKEIKLGKNSKYHSLQDGVLFNKDMTKLIAYPHKTNEKNYTIPDSVVSICESAFQNSGLTSITIPKNMKTISNYVFANCKNLKSINLPESVKSIAQGAFENSGLTSITIPKNVKTIYKKAFYGCENLTSVKFAGAVNNIGKSAFSKCVNLKTVNFTKGYLKKVYDYAFYKCEKLDKITISNTKNVPTIAKSAFNKAKSGIKFYVKNNTVAKKLKAKLQKTNIKKAKIYRSAPILIYKNIG